MPLFKVSLQTRLWEMTSGAQLKKSSCIGSRWQYMYIGVCSTSQQLGPLQHVECSINIGVTLKTLNQAKQKILIKFFLIFWTLYYSYISFIDQEVHTSSHLMQDIFNFGVIHNMLQQMFHVHSIGVLSSFVSFRLRASVQKNKSTRQKFIASPIIMWSYPAKFFPNSLNF